VTSDEQEPEVRSQQARLAQSEALRSSEVGNSPKRRASLCASPRPVSGEVEICLTPQVWAEFFAMTAGSRRKSDLCVRRRSFPRTAELRSAPAGDTGCGC
jgi:hypothetical protein